MLRHVPLSLRVFSSFHFTRLVQPIQWFSTAAQCYSASHSHLLCSHIRTFVSGEFILCTPPDDTRINCSKYIPAECNNSLFIGAKVSRSEPGQSIRWTIASYWSPWLSSNKSTRVVLFSARYRNKFLFEQKQPRNYRGLAANQQGKHNLRNTHNRVWHGPISVDYLFYFYWAINGTVCRSQFFIAYLPKGLGIRYLGFFFFGPQMK